MTTTTTDTPEAWVGCLACYNGGRLVGAWMDGTSADDRELFESLVADDRGGFPGQDDHNPATHEELWVMDFQGYAGFLTGECSPMEAQTVAEFIAEIESQGFDPEAVAAYRDHLGTQYFDNDRDSGLSGFEDDYCGVWDSEQAYAEDFADSVGLLQGAPEELESYFDWEKYARDMFLGDFFSVDTAEGVYVFRCS